MCELLHALAYQTFKYLEPFIRAVDKSSLVEFYSFVNSPFGWLRGSSLLHQSGRFPLTAHYHLLLAPARRHKGTLNYSSYNIFVLDR
jgi:hypothetical protein